MKSIQHLLGAFDGLKISEVLRADFWFGLVAGFGALWWTYRSPTGYEMVAPQLIAVVGVIIGSVLAALAVQAAFFDAVFLRKIILIGRRPTRYMVPFMFTSFLGITSEVALIAFVVVSDGPRLLAAGLAGLSAWFSTWTIISLLLCLDTLVQFVHLKEEAARVPDDIELPDD